ncbi:PREDICTED: protein myomaker isoform X1 [Poecilia mexicana]|uniref:protein myomaker isoform X1 n=1 Tax=Poecilia mexicana TaxID=48701 RepID=UPI00072E8EFC|nr:PREDICTED: protein myomaker isoform X1 [Poecilia mexicana]
MAPSCGGRLNFKWPQWTAVRRPTERRGAGQKCSAVKASPPQSDPAMGAFIAKMLLPTASSLVFLPAASVAAKRGFHTEAMVYFFTMFFTAIYHACDGPGLSILCFMSSGRLRRAAALHHIDVWSADHRREDLPGPLGLRDLLRTNRIGRLHHHHQMAAEDEAAEGHLPGEERLHAAGVGLRLRPQLLPSVSGRVLRAAAAQEEPLRRVGRKRCKDHLLDALLLHNVSGFFQRKDKQTTEEEVVSVGVATPHGEAVAPRVRHPHPAGLRPSALPAGQRDERQQAEGAERLEVKPRSAGRAGGAGPAPSGCQDSGNRPACGFSFLPRNCDLAGFLFKQPSEESASDWKPDDKQTKVTRCKTLR